MVAGSSPVFPTPSKMILYMQIDMGSYNSTQIYGLGNSFLNYIITNKTLEKDVRSLIIEQKECLCLLEDDKTIINYVNTSQVVFEILLSGKNINSRKYATLPNIIEFLKNINMLFENGINKIKITKEKGAEIL